MYWDFGKYVSELTKNSKHGEVYFTDSRLYEGELS